MPNHSLSLKGVQCDLDQQEIWIGVYVSDPPPDKLYVKSENSGLPNVDSPEGEEYEDPPAGFKWYLSDNGGGPYYPVVWALWGEDEENPDVQLCATGLRQPACETPEEEPGPPDSRREAPLVHTVHGFMFSPQAPVNLHLKVPITFSWGGSPPKKKPHASD